jgi:hypothetical protein
MMIKKKVKYKSLGRFLPENFLDDVLPPKVWKRNFLTGSISELKIRPSIIKTVVTQGIIKKREFLKTVSNVIKTYKVRAHEMERSGVRAYKTEAINDEVLLKQRVEDSLLYAQMQTEKEDHEGDFYRWLPSDADNPDPEHALLYGKIFKVGDGDKDGNMPMERFGCRCAIEWLEKAKP